MCADRIVVADRLLGIFILVAGAAIVIAPRSTATLLPLLCLVVLVSSFVERYSLRQIGQLNLATSLWAGFLGLAMLSSTWAADRQATFSDTLLLFFLCCSGWSFARGRRSSRCGAFVISRTGSRSP